jgi:hypothetical protein
MRRLRCRALQKKIDDVGYDHGIAILGLAVKQHIANADNPARSERRGVASIKQSIYSEFHNKV